MAATARASIGTEVLAKRVRDIDRARRAEGTQDSAVVSRDQRVGYCALDCKGQGGETCNEGDQGEPTRAHQNGTSKSNNYFAAATYLSSWLCSSGIDF